MTVQCPAAPVIEAAAAADAGAVMVLYRSQIGTPGCTWDEHYPTPALLARDIAAGNAYVMRDEAGVVVATIAIDQDEEVDSLPCWSGKRGEYRELARLCVKRELQGRGIARQMLSFGMEELRRRGCLGVHFLVSPDNPKALASYRVFGFENLGTAQLYGQSWFCYEKRF